MALNPFFLQGTQSEQRLVQDIINEHLRFHGVEITYIPRKFVNKKNIIEEVQSSKFDDNFAIEAYLNTYDGYGGAGDILTKFGVSIRDELIITISKERFEDFIATFMSSVDDGELLTPTRPREGDLVYFPLGQRLFEVKFVEHEDPFFQLGKNYVYQLKCELFEYEDEVIDTSITEIDTQVQEEGIISTLKLIGVGRTASASPILNGSVTGGYIEEIFLNNDGSGYTSLPNIEITSSPTGEVGDNAEAVGFLTTRGGVTSLEKILLINAGAGYTVAPTITITGGGGTGAAATCNIVTDAIGIIKYNIVDGGVGYGTAPTVTITTGGSGTGAVGIASIGLNSFGDNVLKLIYVSNPGKGYSQVFPSPIVTISAPESISGIGTYIFNEIIIGERSKTEARVKEWDQDTNILKVSNVSIGSTQLGFFPGEIIRGKESGAKYSIQSFSQDDIYNEYTENDIFESEADDILDFSESNPFGTF
jgi:hypothetical protein